MRPEFGPRGWRVRYPSAHVLRGSGRGCCRPTGKTPRSLQSPVRHQSVRRCVGSQGELDGRRSPPTECARKRAAVRESGPVQAPPPSAFGGGFLGSTRRRGGATGPSMPASSRPWSKRSGGRQLHHFERDSAHDGVRIAQRLAHLVVIVALADDELDRLSGGLERGRKVAGLALKLGRL
jgi:hypothetical protein